MTLHQPPDKLDDLLADHLATTLDPQRGRALSTFRQQIQPAAPAPIPFSTAQSRKAVRPFWLSAGIPSALAAGLAVVITLQVAKSPRTDPAPVANPHTVAPAGMFGAAPQPVAQSDQPKSHPLTFEKLDQYEFSRELNGGVAVLPDNTPVRVVRQQTVRHTQWVDPNDKATYTVTEPVEKVGYVRVQPF